MGVPHYDFIIKKKMDFNTIIKNINTNAYKSSRECIDDIFLVFTNCYIFNPPDADIVSIARILEHRFRDKLERMHEVKTRCVKPKIRSKSKNSEMGTGTKELSQEVGIHGESQIAVKQEMEFTESDLLIIKEKAHILKCANGLLSEILNGLVIQFDALSTSVNRLVDLIDNKSEGESDVIVKDDEEMQLSVNEQTFSQENEHLLRIVSNLSEEYENAEQASSFETQQTGFYYNDLLEDLEIGHWLSPIGSDNENIKP
ncbi:unnamed protein product [Rodentolepis nana]|uniref:Bromo domain-containing protein n=1 Tax=Rodentolepis nana TaxID=102285 RepID=A0A0R3TSY3_RODNA|nr:unnamed protein product [Rodentolepis nana]